MKPSFREHDPNTMSFPKAPGAPVNWHRWSNGRELMAMKRSQIPKGEQNPRTEIVVDSTKQNSDHQ